MELLAAGWCGRVRRRIVTVGLLGLGAVPLARAALTDNLLASPTAMSLGNAVTADPPGVESIHFNPAGLARMTGNTFTASLQVATIRTREWFNSAPDLNIGGFKDDPLNGTTSGPVSHRLYLPGVGLLPWHLPALPLPGIGFTFNKPGSPFTFGTATYASMGFSLDRTADPEDPSRFDGRIMQIQRLVFLSPSVGYKVSDTLRVGVSVPIAHHAMVFDTDMRLPNPLVGMLGSIQNGWCPNNGGNLLDTFTVGFCGGGPEGRLNPFKKAANLQLEMTAPIDPTVNIGVLWEPKRWFAMGATFQSGSNTVFRGTYELQVEPMVTNFIQGLNSSLVGPIVGAVLGLPQSVPPVQKGHLVGTVPFPERLQVGFKIKPVNFLQFNVDVGYTNWSKWNTLTFKFDQDVEVLKILRLFGIPDASQVSLPMGIRNEVNYGFGMQVDVTDKLTLRFGYEPRKSSVPANKLSLLAPLPDLSHKSAGFRYKFDGGAELNVAASYISGSYNVPARSDCNLNCDGFFNVLYNPYAATNVAGTLIVRYLGMSYTMPF